MKRITSVSAGKLAGMLSSESYDSNFDLSAFSWDRSDPAAHAEHYGLFLQTKETVINMNIVTSESLGQKFVNYLLKIKRILL